MGVETATFLYHTSSLLGFDSISLKKNQFYNFDYTYYADKYGVLLGFFYRCFFLVYIKNKYNTVVYIGSEGLLEYYDDGRRWEFEFLKEIDVRIVCIYLGSDIKSYYQMDNSTILRGMDTIGTYKRYVMRVDMNEREEKLKKISATTDELANVIFNYPVDQMSYMTRSTLRFPYILPDDSFHLNGNKWNGVEKYVVLHCPSAPISKGTQLVRAAVTKLKKIGYEFEYVELIGVEHERVKNEIKRAHIVLNEFYAFVPGVFGLEAMAGGAVLLTSADENIESMLPEGANEAWIVTPYWDVYDNLKMVLDSPVDYLENKAKIGHQWAIKNGSYSSAKLYLKDIFENI